ncbi:START-like domain-containing protein, partial [uncultured Winogradskyella sp.]
WVEDDEDGASYYFEIRIQVDEITKDVSLMITDFAEEDEIEEGKMLWTNQIGSLKQVLGSR